HGECMDVLAGDFCRERCIRNIERSSDRGESHLRDGRSRDGCCEYQRVNHGRRTIIRGVQVRIKSDPDELLDKRLDADFPGHRINRVLCSKMLVTITWSDALKAGEIVCDRESAGVLPLSIYTGLEAKQLLRGR